MTVFKQTRGKSHCINNPRYICVIFANISRQFHKAVNIRYRKICYVNTSKKYCPMKPNKKLSVWNCTVYLNSKNVSHFTNFSGFLIWEKFGPNKGSDNKWTEIIPGGVNSVCPGSKSIYKIWPSFSSSLLVSHLQNVDFPTPFPPNTQSLSVIAKSPKFAKHNHKTSWNTILTSW